MSIIFPADMKVSRNKTSGFMGHLRLTVWLLRGRIQSRLHLIKHTQSQCLCSCTWYMIIIIIIINPVRLMISIKRKLEGLHTRSCGSAIHPHFIFYFIIKGTMFWVTGLTKSLPMRPNVLVFRQATTTYVVLTLKANEAFLDVGPRVIMWCNKMQFLM